MKDIMLDGFNTVLYDRQDISKVFGVSLKTVANAQRDGRLACRKIGRSYYSRDDEIADFFNLKRKKNQYGY